MGLRTRVALGMSGGVDSAVAAAVLLRAGHEVVGVTCRFQGAGASGQAERDAADVCRHLGIPHIVHRCEGLFAHQVVSPFVRAYADGLTPSPCVRCNALVKVPALMEAADACGCTAVATGHYARVAQLARPGADGRADRLPGSAPNSAPVREGAAHAASGQETAAPSGAVPWQPGRFVVKRALDARKDQSYMLAMLGQEALSRLLLPLGGLTKAEVRIMAADLGLPVAEKAESQDICFAPQGYRALLAAHGLADEPGPIVDVHGTVLGEHAGLANYTIGQRKGIGVAAPEPYYVVAKRPQTRELVVAFADKAQMDYVVVSSPAWQAFDRLEGELHAMAKLRYRSAAGACIITPAEGGRVRVLLERPWPATAPGQYAVFSLGDTLLGGGMIEEVGLR